ncbi:GMC family oxidoreductase [Oceanicella sp. SM1341]|uniref:GMC family oxidoreductase n=1 Tax=Oceanicella sp. SM1341 TaxID=1548889 RepID=UPI0018E52240|nr:GMC family oxidoreductase N-terminal domain-containing protein [Oceanicella sp. SM1341]
MIDARKERARRLLDLTATGRMSRRQLMSRAAAAGLLGVMAPEAIAQAVRAGEVQAMNGRTLAPGYDYIVVGSGSAGSAVARRILDGTDARVLVIEAGGSDVGVPEIDTPSAWVANIGSERDWTYFYAPTEQVNGRSILLSRGKVLGGSSSINALVWVRGNPSDYDGWAAAGATGWDWASVLPYLKRMEDWEDGETALRGAGGPIRVERAKDLHPVATALIASGRSLGMAYVDDMNGETSLGVGPINMNLRDGTRDSASRAYLRPAMDNPRLTVLTGAKVTRLLLEGTRCTGVEVLVEGRPLTLRAEAEVVLSAGAIDTPRLMMLSGLGPADELRALGIAPVADLAGVGRNLQEHILLGGMIFEAAGPMPPPNNNLEGSTFFSKSRGDLAVPDLMFVSMQIPYLMPELAAANPVPPNAFTISPGLMGVQSRGYMRMLSDRHDGPLEIQPNLLAEPADMDALVHGVELGQELAQQPGFREITGRQVVPKPVMTRAEKEAFVRMSCSTYFHPVGTCRMGTDAEAVTAPDLRVHGIEGLRIADASVMPRITGANTNVPSILIGERAGDFITG